MEHRSLSIIKDVLAHWDQYLLGYSKVNLDPMKIVAKHGVSRSTAYDVKYRAEYLHESEKALSPQMESQDTVQGGKNDQSV